MITGIRNFFNQFIETGLRNSEAGTEKALQIATASVIIGTAAAFAVDHFYGSTLTDTAVTAFGIIDDAPRFSLFNLASPLLFVVIGSIFIISIIASIQPLIRNVRRSPIRDMRDE